MQEDGVTMFHEGTFNFSSVAANNTWFQLLSESILTLNV